MLIRVGFDITLDCEAETPLVLSLYPHPSRAADVIGSEVLGIGVALALMSPRMGDT